MKYGSILFGAAALALAACSGGGDDEARLVKACVEDGGGTQETCECFAGHAKENLSAPLFSKFVEGALGDGENADKLMEDLTEAEQAELIGMVFSGATTCGADAFGL